MIKKGTGTWLHLNRFQNLVGWGNRPVFYAPYFHNIACRKINQNETNEIEGAGGCWPCDLAKEGSQERERDDEKIKLWEWGRKHFCCRVHLSLRPIPLTSSSTPGIHLLKYNSINSPAISPAHQSAPSSSPSSRSFFVTESLPRATYREET